MSRIGKMPIAIPAGVTVDIAENNKVTVKGPTPWQGSPPFLTVSGSRSCPDKGKRGVSLPAGKC